MDQPDYLVVVVGDRIATVTINRPDEMNALSWPLMDQLADTLKRCERDPDIGVIVLKGAGRGFSAGYDFKAYDYSRFGPGVGPADGRLEPRGVPGYGPGAWNSRAHVQGHIAYEALIWGLYKPVIAQVHGFALGGASTLALVCDLTIVADDAKIGYPPARWLASGDNVAIYSFVAGLKKAKELAFGEIFTGRQAADIGLANYSFPVDELPERTREIATRVAAIDPELLMLSKTAVNRVWEIIGIRTAMETIGEIDTISHLADTARPFREAVNRHNGNIGEALRDLNTPWGGV